jgi:hypothetical protein
MIKNYLFVILFILLANCSLNSDSKYWTENSVEDNSNKEMIEKIKLKADDITSMTIEEYEIYLEEYTKNSDYPDINK